MTFATTTLAAGAAATLLLIAPGPAFRTGAPLPAAFGLLAGGTLLGLCSAVAGIGAALVGARRGIMPAPALLGGVVLGLVAALPPVLAIWSARGLPAIHDISTDLTDPPGFHAVLPLRADAPNPVTVSPDVAARQRQGYPDLGPLTMLVPADAAFDQALAAARQAGWEIVDSDRTAGRIEATATTRWFGFKDDVVVRLTPVERGTKVDVRSVSRLGVGDLGANARRIREYLGALRS